MRLNTLADKGTEHQAAMLAMTFHPMLRSTSWRLYPQSVHSIKSLRIDHRFNKTSLKSVLSRLGEPPATRHQHCARLEPPQAVPPTTPLPAISPPPRLSGARTEWAIRRTSTSKSVRLPTAPRDSPGHHRLRKQLVVRGLKSSRVRRQRVLRMPSRPTPTRARPVVTDPWSQMASACQS
jgi:hypothetical protein